MRRRAVVVVVFVVAALGCVTVQDLGSHAPQGDGGAPGVDASLPPFPFPFPEGGTGKIFFVTEGLYTGGLGGLAGADQICTMEARGAGLSGAFKAWLSTSSENAKSRIAPVGPWQFVGGRFGIVFDASVGLPRAFPQYTAKGGDLFFSNDTSVWTATTSTGVLNTNGASCAGWTSALGTDKGSYGTLTRIGVDWTDDQGFDATSQSSPCSSRLRLYCFEQ